MTGQRPPRRPHSPGASPARQARAQGHRPKKSLGQHFLRDRDVLQQSIEAAGLTPESIVIEIGPGLGALTRELLRAAGRVIAVEYDDVLAERLRGEFADNRKLRLITGNVLTRTPEEWLRAGLDLAEDAPLPPYTLVANLPYNIANAVLRKFLGAAHRPTRMVVMVQHEVAKSIAAAPGSMTPLSVSVQLYAAAQIVATVPPEAFFPSPKVDSAIVRIDVTPAPGYRVAVPSLPTFFRLVRACFVGRRKQLRNSLRGNLVLSDETVKAMLAEADITSDRRPQTLTMDEWAALARAYAPHWSGDAGTASDDNGFDDSEAETLDGP